MFKIVVFNVDFCYLSGIRLALLTQDCVLATVPVSKR